MIDNLKLEEKIIHQALEKYSQKAFSFGQAARFAKISVWKFADLLKEHKIPLQLDKEELEHELKPFKK